MPFNGVVVQVNDLIKKADKVIDSLRDQDLIPAETTARRAKAGRKGRKL